jgi:hypothetical protein
MSCGFSFLDLFLQLLRKFGSKYDLEFVCKEKKANVKSFLGKEMSFASNLYQVAAVVADMYSVSQTLNGKN